jgi:hypothetical protein
MMSTKRKLEGIWKKVDMAKLRYYQKIFLEELEKNHRFNIPTEI